ncbi:hypothetical protein NBRC10513v2_004575 [Rhodotorula toruloides]|uniref:Uncharacterized protein n=1 Tax=Rhodotorula toruloides TaxID=5286 RepID=A0A0K3CAV4_RHOTO
MGLTTTLKGMVGFHTGPEGPREEGQSSSLPPAGQQPPPSPHFQGPGGEEAPQNGGNCEYERVGMEPASKGAAERAAAAATGPTTP